MVRYFEPDYEVTGKFVTVDGVHFFVDLEKEVVTVITVDRDLLDIIIPDKITIGDETFSVIGFDVEGYKR